MSKEQRDAVKHLAYALLYGMGPTQLAKRMGTRLEEAAANNEAFCASIPGVMAWRNG